MRGIGLLGITTALFWMVVAISVANSLLSRQDRWWEEEGSPYCAEEQIDVVQPVVTEPLVFWKEM